MSLFGLLGDFDDDALFNINPHFRQMRQMNSIMSSMMMPDPFNMLTPFGHDFAPRTAPGLLGFPPMPNINRLLSNPDLLDGGNGASYCSSSVISMSSTSDGRPHIYQQTSSTKTGPGGVRETRKTVQDSRTGVKKMAIGHHIGERSHIIEREQNLRSGENEERQEFINLEEEEAESFDREFTNKARHVRNPVEMIEDVTGRSTSPRSHHSNNMLAIEAPPQRSSEENKSSTSSSSTIEHPATSQSTSSSGSKNESTSSRSLSNNVMPKSRRQFRTPTSSSPLAFNSSVPRSIHPHPYSAVPRRNYRSKQPKHYDD